MDVGTAPMPGHPGRWAVVDDAGRVLDDVRGYGYTSPEAALRGWAHVRARLAFAAFAADGPDAAADRMLGLDGRTHTVGRRSSDNNERNRS